MKDELTEEVKRLVQEHQGLSKTVYAQNSLSQQTMELGNRIQECSQSLVNHTEKVEYMLAQVASALQVLQKLTEGEARFTQALEQYQQGSQDKSLAFSKFVDAMLLHKETYGRLEKRLSRNMETLDADAQKYLETRRKQLDHLYDESLTHFDDFINREKSLFEKSIAQLKPEGLHHAIEQLELLTPIHDYLTQLDLSEEGTSALVTISTTIKELNQTVSRLDTRIKRQITEAERREEGQENELVQEIRSVKRAILFQPLITMVLLLVLLGILGFFS